MTKRDFANDDRKGICIKKRAGQKSDPPSFYSYSYGVRFQIFNSQRGKIPFGFTTLIFNMICYLAVEKEYGLSDFFLPLPVSGVSDMEKLISAPSVRTLCSI